MNNKLKYYKQLYGKEFRGWDFSHIFQSGRAHESPLPWSYFAQVIPHVRKAKSMLDMGTGGGEFLASLAPLPKETFATEAYKPNVTVAKKNLKRFGVKVVSDFADVSLPFAKDKFDLIINRHESFYAEEVHRILKPGGLFITQQVGGMNDTSLNKFLRAPMPHEYDLGWSLKEAITVLKEAGFKVVAKKSFCDVTRFYDIGALLYYIKAVPWQVPDFSVTKYFTGLQKIEETIERKGYFDLNMERFLVKAVRAQAPKLIG